VVVTRAVAAGVSARWVVYIEDDGNFLIGEDWIDPDTTKPEDLVVVCFDCLLGQHPAVGRGMDLARQVGTASYSEGAWK
jgi:hypothetical protein